jgi:hypothetical protein
MKYEKTESKASFPTNDILKEMYNLLKKSLTFVGKIYVGEEYVEYEAECEWRRGENFNFLEYEYHQLKKISKGFKSIGDIILPDDFLGCCFERWDNIPDFMTHIGTYEELNDAYVREYPWFDISLIGIGSDFKEFKSQLKIQYDKFNGGGIQEKVVLLNEQYSAIIVKRSSWIKVGCQSFHVNDIKEVVKIWDEFNESTK